MYATTCTEIIKRCNAFRKHYMLFNICVCMWMHKYMMIHDEVEFFFNFINKSQEFGINLNTDQFVRWFCPCSEKQCAPRKGKASEWVKRNYLLFVKSFRFVNGSELHILSTQKSNLLPRFADHLLLKEI